MGLLEPLLVLGVLGGVYALLLRPARSPDSKGRRASLVDGRRRDRDPFDGPHLGAAVLTAVALADLASVASDLGPDTTFALGIGLAAVLTVATLRPVVYFLVGAAALTTAVLRLFADEACGGDLTGGQRVTVLVGAGGFLAVVVLSRRLVAPLRARGPAGWSSFLVLYGVVVSATFAANLHRAGALSDWTWRSYGTALLCLLLLAAGTAVQPVFATAAVGVAVAFLTLVTDSASGCLESVALAGVLSGYVVARVVAAALVRRWG